MAGPDQDFEQKFAALRASYEARLDELETSAGALTDGDGGVAEALEAIHAGSHKLAGNASTFGFPELGKAAQVIEQECEAAAGADDHTRIAEMVRALRGTVGKSDS